MTGISIVYVTCRVVPRFDWFIASVVHQIGDADVEVIFVDGQFSADRTDELAALVNNRFRFRHVPSKPTPYNGLYRLTQRDYFAAASARNTGLLYASQPYIVFVDDASIVMPGWWEQVRAAASEALVIAGAYQKRWGMVVEDGILVGSRSDSVSVDSRWCQGDDHKNSRIAGGQLFGSSFAAPRSLLLEVNGFDELCDSIGGEDWHLGVRIEWTQTPIHYSRRMLTVESEELHREPSPAARIDKVALPDAYMAKLADFGVTRRHIDGAFDSSHMLLDILFGVRSLQPLGNYYFMPELRPQNLLDTIARFPTEYWFDDQPLREL